jgi:hypothetical protein
MGDEVEGERLAQRLVSKAAARARGRPSEHRGDARPSESEARRPASEAIEYKKSPADSTAFWSQTSSAATSGKDRDLKHRRNEASEEIGRKKKAEARRLRRDPGDEGG